jgi:2-oxoisovalerate dehydrogenase E1 component
MSSPAPQPQTQPQAQPQPAARPGLTPELLRWGHEQAVFTRAIILKCVNLTQSGKAKFWIGGPGEEVHGAATALALHHVQPDGAKRSVHGHYRSDGLTLAIGSLAGWTGDRHLAWKLLRQQLTRATDDMSLGRQMVNHWVIPELGVQPTGTPVGMQCGRAAGYARGFQVKGVERTVNIAVIGDGTTAEGDIHDAMNAGSVWRLPFALIITDNGIAIQTRPEAGRGIKDFKRYAEAFGFAAFDVDGHDFEACYAGTREAFEHCASGKGPVLIHATVPRLMGHSSAGDMAFRYDLRDPVVELGEKLVKRGLLRPEDTIRRLKDAKGKGWFHSNHDVGRVMAEADARINAMATAVLAEPLPEASTLDLHVMRPLPKVEEPKAEGQTRVPYALAIRTALDRNLAKGNAVLWGQDVARLGGVMSCTRGLATRYPKMCVDAPLNEPLIIGTAFGASLHRDLWAFPEIQFGDYSLNCLHWFVAAGLWSWTTNGRSVPKMCVRMPVDPFHGGAVYHSMSVDGYFHPIPGIVMCVPSTSFDVYGLLRTASEFEGTVLILEPKILYRLTKGLKLPGEPAEINATRIMAGEDILPLDDFRVPFGKAAVRREGVDLTIVAWGWAVHQALEAAEKLEHEGVSAEVIDLRTLVPYDREAVMTSVAKTGRLLVAHPDRTFGSFGRQVQGDLAEASPGTPSLVVGMRNLPAVSQCVELEDHIALQSEWIEDAARKLLDVKVASAAAATPEDGASWVRADDPLAWVRWSSTALSG